MASTHLVKPILLQNPLTAPAASFARQHSFGYASSQELAVSTRHGIFRIRKDSQDEY